ncbi:glycosyl transferase family 2 [[Leptolyngbya] sp. PCC 7376]|uniref:glycosyltransferase family 2 protein n=1 Tax=[Leptolyngbya] sp. PCC 7376 TaxID=111781 RepID=UPI00029ED5B8|nr:glycosyltransferase family 2 protein [[Leptolyngbya] sp. PCC 7376]AFY40286.1 glycosyl transferase family 2 [[Leptolyngbya] sp. PCC 7376]
MKNIVAVIPVLNEEATIETIIHQLRLQGIETICVVDNGSSDRTPFLAAQAGATVLHESRRGYGQACLRGIRSPQVAQAEWILFCDGDGSDDLSDLPKLLSLRSQYDFILGNRRSTASGRSQLTPIQNFGNWLATRLIHLGWGYAYEDLGPLRLIRRQTLEQFAMTNRDFGWTVEMQAKAAEHWQQNSLRICEQPVNYLPRQGGQSKISGTVRGSVKAGQVILATLAKLYWQKTGQVFWQRWQAFVRQKSMQQILLGAIALLMLVGSIWAVPNGDFLNDPNAVPHFWVAMGLMSIGFLASHSLSKVNRYWFWGLAIAPRLLLLAMYPGDDIWRYLWEGHLQNHGFNPYLLAPDADVLNHLRFDWWSKINHPDHAAIYPPVTQLGFRVLAALSPSVLLFKSAFVVADLGICRLLSCRFGYKASLIYAWNPLVIYSFAGGGHYDSWFLLALVAAWLNWDSPHSETEGKRRSPPNKLTLAKFKSVLWLGLSIATKWMSLPVLGFLAWRQVHSADISSTDEQTSHWRFKNWGKAIALLLLGILPFLIAALPFCQGWSCPVVPITSPFVSYGRSASLIPQWVTYLWPASVKLNWIYAVPLFISLLWGLRKFKSVGRFTEHYLITLMLLSPIIHAWYFTWLVPFAVSSRNWGIQLISISAFIYFALPYQLALGMESWSLSYWQQSILWGPFLLGLFLFGIQRQKNHN